MRFLNPSISASGARETTASRTSLAARCGTLPSIWSEMNEQLGQPSAHPGPNMKWYTISWLLPPKRSASVSLPRGPSNTYVFTTFSQGSSRRCLLSSSRSRVNSFSFFKNSMRAASHAAGGTTFGFSIALVAMTDSPFSLFQYRGRTDDLKLLGISWKALGSVNAEGMLQFTYSRIHRNHVRFEAGALRARSLRFRTLTRLLNLCEHLANGVVGSWAALLAPGFQVLA